MSIVVEKDLDAVGREAWDALAAASPGATVFQAWGWHQAYWRAQQTAGDGRRTLLLIGVREHGALRALAPLMIETAGGQRVVKLLGDRRTPQADLLGVEDESATTRILDYLAERADDWDALELRNLPERSPTVAALRAWIARRQLPATWGRPLPQRTLRVGQDDARHHSAPPSTSTPLDAHHTDDAAEIAARLNQLFALHVHSHGTREAPSAFVERWQRDLARHVVDDPGAGARAVLTTLGPPEAPAAMHLGIADGHTLWAWESAYDVGARAGRRADVERSLVREVAALARARGLREVAFAWSDQLADDALPTTVAGQLASVHVTSSRPATLKSRLRSAVKRAPTYRRAREIATELRQAAGVARGAERMVEERKRRSEAVGSHRDFYDVGFILGQYLRLPRLLKPEHTIFRELHDALRSMRVLDVAVGAGRTAPYLATIGREYRAFDYATRMVDACQRIVGDIVDPSAITCDDARDMRTIPDQSCDFLLISYNGIDTVGGESDRLRVLDEVKRVTTPGGYFCMSSHNIKSLTSRGSGDSMLTGGEDAVATRLLRWRRYRLLRAANPQLATLREQPNAMIYDAGGEYAFPHYYIAPSAQVRQLEAHGFRDVRVFSGNTGDEVTDPARWDQLIDSWAYYLCRV